MISKEQKVKRVLKEITYDKMGAKILNVGDTVYVTGLDYDNCLYLTKAVVKKIRHETEIGLEFEETVGGGHCLDGCARDYHGYWIGLDTNKYLITTRNMEQSYSYYRIG